jgi:hypothetical protein
MKGTFIKHSAHRPLPTAPPRHRTAPTAHRPPPTAHRAMKVPFISAQRHEGHLHQANPDPARAPDERIG